MALSADYRYSNVVRFTYDVHCFVVVVVVVVVVAAVAVTCLRRWYLTLSE